MGRFVVRLWKFNIPVNTNVVIPLIGILVIIALTVLFGFYLEQTELLPGAFRWSLGIAAGLFLMMVFIFAVNRHKKAQMLKH